MSIFIQNLINVNFINDFMKLNFLIITMKAFISYIYIFKNCQNQELNFHLIFAIIIFIIILIFHCHYYYFLKIYL